MKMSNYEAELVAQVMAGVTWGAIGLACVTAFVYVLGALCGA